MRMICNASLRFAAVVLIAGVFATGASSHADLVLQLTFDDENDPGLDDSGNDYFGEVEGALWVDDAEREGVLEFSGADDGFVRIRDLEELPADGFTIACWVYRDPLTAANNAGVFQVQFGGDVPTTTPVDKVIGGWVASTGGVWGRLHQEDRTTINLDSSTFFMEDETWTHLAYRADGEFFEVIVNGEAGIGPAIPYDGTLDLHDALFIGKQATASWGGRMDDFRVYSRALTVDEIELVMEGENPEGPACPAEGDTHCVALDFQAPAGNVTGTYVLMAEGADDTGDGIRYTFRAESETGEEKQIGPQPESTARIRLTEGKWTLSVTVDDSSLCDDEAADASCSTEVEVKPREPSPEDLKVYLAFDDEAEPGLDSSGNDLETLVNGAVWVDDDERGGALEFSGGDNGTVRIPLPEELPGGDFTITCWAYRDPFVAANNAGLFQFQLGGDVPTTTPVDKVLGGWVAEFGGVWGRLHQEDRTTINLDSNTFFMEDEVWTHLAYRGNGETFEVLVNAEEGLGPSIPYDGTLDLHDVLFIGKQAAASWGGRIDDFRVYSRALTDVEIELVMEGEDLFPTESTFLRGDADGNGMLQITDAISALNYLFSGTFTPTCLDALDWDDNGRVELADPVSMLNRQFGGGAPAPAPGSENCGPDPTGDDLPCDSFAACR